MIMERDVIAENSCRVLWCIPVDSVVLFVCVNSCRVLWCIPVDSVVLFVCVNSCRCLVVYSS